MKRFLLPSKPGPAFATPLGLGVWRITSLIIFVSRRFVIDEKQCILFLMNNSNAKVTDRQILTDATGKPTHVVLTIEAYERIAELLEDAEDVLEVERRLKNPEFISLEEVRVNLGL